MLVGVPAVALPDFAVAGVTLHAANGPPTAVPHCRSAAGRLRRAQPHVGEGGVPSGTVRVALVSPGQLPLGAGALQLCAAAGSASRASASDSARHRNVAAYGITAWTSMRS